MNVHPFYGQRRNTFCQTRGGHGLREIDKTRRKKYCMQHSPAPPLCISWHACARSTGNSEGGSTTMPSRSQQPVTKESVVTLLLLQSISLGRGSCGICKQQAMCPARCPAHSEFKRLCRLVNSGLNPKIIFREKLGTLYNSQHFKTYFCCTFSLDFVQRG